MTRNEINTIIAEYCGWTQIVNSGLLVSPPILLGYPPVAVIGKKEYIPNYCGSLEEMKKAEEKMFSFDWRNRDTYDRMLSRLPWDGRYATALERAERFVRAIGKWEDENEWKCPCCGHHNTVVPQYMKCEHPHCTENR